MCAGELRAESRAQQLSADDLLRKLNEEHEDQVEHLQTVHHSKRSYDTGFRRHTADFVACIVSSSFVWVHKYFFLTFQRLKKEEKSRTMTRNWRFKLGSLGRGSSAASDMKR